MTKKEKRALATRRAREWRAENPAKVLAIQRRHRKKVNAMKERCMIGGCGKHRRKKNKYCQEHTLARVPSLNRNGNISRNDFNCIVSELKTIGIRPSNVNRDTFFVLSLLIEARKNILLHVGGKYER